MFVLLFLNQLKRAEDQPYLFILFHLSAVAWPQKKHEQ